jgi:heme oxygenase
MERRSRDGGGAVEDGGRRLTEALRARTRELHCQAERSGIVQDLLAGRAGRAGYALLLRNLLPAYQALEEGLDRHRRGRVGALVPAGLHRAGALAADLEAIAGGNWKEALPLLPAGAGYARRVRAAADGDDGWRLLGHAYVRYLGDLSGGQILSRLLARSLGLGPEALAFHAFPAIADPRAFKADWREAVDRAGAGPGEAATVIEEARAAFRLNIELSRAVQAAAPRR